MMPTYDQAHMNRALQRAVAAGDRESAEAIAAALGGPPQTATPAPPPQQTAAPAPPPLTQDERDRSGVGQRFLAGLAEGTGGVAAAELVGTQEMKDYINQYQRDRARGLGDRWDIAGGIGQAIGFMGALPLGGLGLKGLTALAKAGTLPARVGTAAERVGEAIVGKRIRDYATQGAVSGALTPMEKEGDNPWLTKAEQIVTGGVLGGATRPVVAGVSGAGKWAKEKGAELINAYRPGDAGAERVIKKALQKAASPEERKELADLLAQSSKDPRFFGMTAEQILQSENKGLTTTKLLETERLQATPGRVTYQQQEEDLLGKGREWLEKVRGGENLLAQEKADKAALVKAFESAKKAPVLVDARQTYGLLKKEIAATKPTESVKDPLTGRPIVGPKGEAVQYKGPGVIAEDLHKSLQNIQERLIVKDPPKQFMERLQRIAADEVPDSPNIKVKGYANKLKEILGGVGKGDDAGEALKELRASIKKSGMANDEIGRAVKSVSKAFAAGPARLTDNPSTVIQLREEANELAKKASGHDAAVLRGVVKQMDVAVGQAVPELKAALSQRVTAGTDLNRRKVAAALLEAAGGRRGEAPTPKTLIEALNNPDFVRKVTGGFKPEEETFAKYFPSNQADLDRLARTARGVAGYKPETREEMARTLAGRTDEQVMHMLNQPLTILSNVGKFAAKRLEAPVDRTLLRLQQNPEQMAAILRELPPTMTKRAVNAVVENILAQQAARTVAPRLAAERF